MTMFVTILVSVLVLISVILLLMLAIHSGVFGNVMRHVFANNFKYDEDGNKEIAKIIERIESGELTVSERSYATVHLSDNTKIWVANYPYACYHVYDGYSAAGYRLSWKNFTKMDKLFKQYTKD